MGDASSRRQLFALTVVLLPVSLALYPLHVGAGWLYLGCALLLGGWFIWLAAKGLRGEPDKRWAKKTFLFSLTYLAGLFLALTIDALLHR